MAQQQGYNGHRPAAGQLAFEGFVGLSTSCSGEGFRRIRMLRWPACARSTGADKVSQELPPQFWHHVLLKIWYVSGISPVPHPTTYYETCVCCGCWLYASPAMCKNTRRTTGAGTFFQRDARILDYSSHEPRTTVVAYPHEFRVQGPPFGSAKSNFST